VPAGDTAAVAKCVATTRARFLELKTRTSRARGAQAGKVLERSIQASKVAHFLVGGNSPEVSIMSKSIFDLRILP
jgi:hypothetical protein